MKRILLLALACLVMVVTQAHAGVVDEIEDNDFLDKARSINSTTNFANDLNFTQNGGLQSYSEYINGSYSDRDFDFYKLNLGGDYVVDLTLSAFTKNGNKTGQTGSLGVWEQLSDNTWKIWGVMSAEPGAGIRWEAPLGKGTWVIGVAGSGASYVTGKNGFRNGGMSGGDYQLGITVANPEPSAFLLTGLGLLGLFGARKKLSRSKTRSA